MMASECVDLLERVDAPEEPIEVDGGSWGSERRYVQSHILRSYGVDDMRAPSGSGYELPDGSTVVYLMGEWRAYEDRDAQYDEVPWIGVDDRSRRYLEAVLDRVGYLDDQTGDSLYTAALADAHDVDAELLEKITLGHAIGQGPVRARVCEYESPHGAGTVYVAEWGVRAGIDDVAFYAYLFSSRPSGADLRAAQLALEARRRLSYLSEHISGLRRLEAEYTCWECGRETHWLDSEPAGEPKDLASRIERADSRYCGC